MKKSEIINKIIDDLLQDGEHLTREFLEGILYDGFGGLVNLPDHELISLYEQPVHEKLKRAKIVKLIDDLNDQQNSEF